MPACNCTHNKGFAACSMEVRKAGERNNFKEEVKEGKNERYKSRQGHSDSWHWREEIQPNYILQGG